MKTINVIKKNEDFQMIFKKGHSMNGKYLVVYFLPNQFGYNRFGFCVGKKIGIAVRRNRMKRLLREAVKVIEYPEQKSWDIVLVARPQMIQASFQSIILDIKHIFTKTGIIIKDSNQNKNNMIYDEDSNPAREREDSF